MYELATGIKVYDFMPKFKEIGEHTFSLDGQNYIVSDNSRKTIKSYQLDQKFHSIISSMLSQMQQNKDFWKQYPINLYSDQNLTTEEKIQIQEMQNQENPNNAAF